MPLQDGVYSCGVVLSLVEKAGKIDRRMFLAGLLDWYGQEPPSSSLLVQAKVLASGYTHIKTITETGGCILGTVNLNDMPSEIQQATDSVSSWGYNFIAIMAEKFHAAS